MNNDGKKDIDERQRKILTEALALASLIAFLFILGTIITRLFITKDTKNITSEYRLLILMSLTIIIYLYAKKEYDLPKTVFGNELPTGNSKDEKKIRLKHYLIDAIRLSIIFTSIGAFIDDNIPLPEPYGDSSILTYAVSFAFRFIIFMIINYFWHEHNVKKYNKFLKSLEDEDIN